MPSNFNSRVQVKYITKEISEYVLYITLAQTQSSAVLTEDLAEAGGLLALNTEAVPAAAGYMTPDPDLISSTQPIPDHIVSGVIVSAAYKFDLVPQIDPSVKLYNHGEGPY